MLDTTLLELLSFSHINSSTLHPIDLSIMPHLPLSYFLQKSQNHDFQLISINKKIQSYDLLCDICMSPSSKSSTLISCTCCGVSVHSDCYGGELIINSPIHEWICERCLYVMGHEVPSDSLKCKFCKESKGSLVKIEGEWLHIVCVLWLKDAKFVDRMRRKCIVNIGQKNLKECVFCARKDKFGVKCERKECQITFHAKCAQINGLRPAYLVNQIAKKYKLKFYCKYHRQEMHSNDLLESKLRASHMTEMYVPVKQEEIKEPKKVSRKPKKDLIEIVSDDSEDALVIRYAQTTHQPMIKKEPEEYQETKKSKSGKQTKKSKTSKTYMNADSEIDPKVRDYMEYCESKIGSGGNDTDYTSIQTNSTSVNNENYLIDDGIPPKVNKRTIQRKAVKKLQAYEKKLERKKKLTGIQVETQDSDGLLVYNNPSETTTHIKANGTKIVIKQQPRTPKSKSTMKNGNTTINKQTHIPIVIRPAIPDDSHDQYNFNSENRHSIQTSLDDCLGHFNYSTQSLLEETSPSHSPPPTSNPPSNSHIKPKEENIIYYTFEKALQKITGINSISTLDDLDKEFNQYLNKHSKPFKEYYDISVIPDLSAYFTKTKVQRNETSILVYNYSSTFTGFSSKPSTLSKLDQDAVPYSLLSDEPGTVKKLKLNED